MKRDVPRVMLGTGSGGTSGLVGGQGELWPSMGKESVVLASCSGVEENMPVSGPLRRSVRVNNPYGLHMRPATMFAQLAKGFKAAITVWNGPKRADGKSSLDLILLIADPGSELLLEVDGEDAEQALEALSELLSSLGEDYE